MKNSLLERKTKTSHGPSFGIGRRAFLLGTLGTLLTACRERTPQIDPYETVGPPADKTSIFILLPDALRADALGCYGAPKQMTPFLDGLAAQSVLFENCYAQASWTKPSVASLFTGFTPRVHQAVVTGWTAEERKVGQVQTLRDGFTTMAEVFQSLGYATGLFTINPHTQQEWGFAQGFDEYRYIPGTPLHHQLNLVMRHVKTKRDRPFFFMMHAKDPHGPYTPEPGLFQRAHGVSQAEVFADLDQADRKIIEAYRLIYEPEVPWEEKKEADLYALSQKGRKYLQMAYSAEVRGVDENVARFFRILERLRLRDRVLFVLLSDHGESFGEHGSFEHGNNLFDEELHVPLIFHPPGGCTGVRVQHDVRLFDALPTAAVLAGAEELPENDGIPLLDREWNVTVQESRRVVSFVDHDEADPANWEMACRQGGLKAINKSLGGEMAVYDLENDPLEQRDLLATEQRNEPRVREIVQECEKTRERERRMAQQFGPPEWTLSTENLEEELGALGYL